MFITMYSLLLSVALVVSAPWWLWRMATTGRYREGLGERLGMVPAAVKAAVGQGPTVWVHAVSVGEVLAAERLVHELEAALPGFVIAISTTTATGNKLARERFPACPVFYFPLDFGFAMRAWLGVLRPALVVLVESEFWPRMLVECERGGVPVAVVNARVSDRSFPRYMRLRWLWTPLLRKVRLFLAQGEESAARLRAMGAPTELVQVSGNLKFDLPPMVLTPIAKRLRELRGANRIVVAGSTHEGEEQMLLRAWPQLQRGGKDIILVIAPRHPQRFEAVLGMIRGSGAALGRCSELLRPDAELAGGTILLLDTLGDLSSVYAAAQVAFVGGSLVPHGGQNPLEAARFGVPIVMGHSFENFREIVNGMGSIRLIEEPLLGHALIDGLRNGQSRGKRGKVFFIAQAGATRRTVAALKTLLAGKDR
jgi:3-deoxy-D-manno-octulosonic-acid transferase